MKKLTNVSPFILLLFPVFIVMLLTFTSNTEHVAEKEIATKTANATVTDMVKTATAILK